MSGPPRADRPAVEKAIADLIRALGMNPTEEPDLAATPQRVADLYLECFCGLDPAAEPELALMPHDGSPQVVSVRDLTFHSMCVHHFAPFFGRALVAYLPDRQLIGISGMARLLEYYSRRPQIQERLGTQIADHLEKRVRPLGVAVILEARHLCMEMRGVRRGGWVETRLVRGALAEPQWAEALRLGPRPA